MGTLHWLVLVPYYFFGAMTLSLALAIGSRLLRLPVTMERLVTTAMTAVVLALFALFITGTVWIDDFGAIPVVVLLVGSLLLAALDAALKGALPLPGESEPARRNTSDPQVL